MSVLVQGLCELHAADDGDSWDKLLEGIGHDVYHTAAYHRIGGLGTRGKAFAFSYREQDNVFLWPYLLSPIDGSNAWNDVSSVYGYPGPVASGDAEFLERAWAALLDHWAMQRVVSVFTRFHPLLGNWKLLHGLKDNYGMPASEGCRLVGPTVSIDLTPSSEQQVKSYQKVLRQEIRKSREMGFVTEEDFEWQHVEDFVHLYSDTMARRNSRSEYLVDGAWVKQFRHTLGDRAKLFVTKWDGEVAAALLAMDYRPYIHAHLTGINANLTVHSPLKVLLDDVREWGTARGSHNFHLGGGLGGREDSLFQFKRKFSPVTKEFWTGAWVLERQVYRELEERHRQELALQGVEAADPGFFPIYRYKPS
jgi:hypothetical protein